MSQDPGFPPQPSIIDFPRLWMRWIHLFYQLFKSAFLWNGTNLTINGTFVVFGADDATRFTLARSTGTTGSMLFAGGGGQTSGGYFEAWGDQHTTRADDFEAGAAGTAVLDWDESAGELTVFTGTGGSKTQALLLNTNQDATFGGTITVPTADSIQFGDNSVRITGNASTDILSFYAGGTEQIEVSDGTVTHKAIVSLGPSDTLTIATGAVTATQSWHFVDTESAASTDDLDTINGGSVGGVLVLQAANSARTVVVKNGTGNIQLAGSDFSLDNGFDTITLIWTGSSWCEISRSDNGA